MYSPPKILEMILSVFIPINERDHLLGCYEELFREKTYLKGTLWYIFQIIVSIPIFVKSNIIWGIIMIINFLKISFRQLFKHKLFGVINISGLTVGLTVFMLMIIYVNHEMSYDKHIKNGDQIFRLLTTMKDVRSVNYYTGFPEFLRTQNQNYDICGVDYYNLSVVKNEKKLIPNVNVVYAEKNVFSYFDIKLKIGDPENVIDSPNSIVISKNIAEKYFPNESAIGKIITIDNKDEFNITGVFEDIPETSHLKFDMLFSFNTYKKLQPHYYTMERRTAIHMYTRAKNGIVDPSLINHIEKYLNSRSWIESNGEFKCELQPLTDIHLFSNDLRWDNERGNILFVYAAITIGVFILLIVLFNYLNLLTAKNFSKVKEVAVRKVLGSDTKQLFLQYFSENALFIFTSLVLSIILFALILPFFNQITNRNFDINNLFKFDIILYTAFILVLFSLLLTIIPLLKINKLKITEMLNSKVPVFIFAGTRKITGKHVFITIQLTTTIFLFCLFMGFNSQMQFMINKNPGYESENLLVVQNPWDSNKENRYKNFKNNLINQSGIIDISTIANIPGKNITNYCRANLKGKSKKSAVQSGIVNVSHNTFDIFRSKIIVGRNFNIQSTIDEKSSIIINKTAAESYGNVKVGESILEGIWGSDSPQKIIGIVEDIYIKSMYQKVQPVIYRIRSWSCSNILVKIDKKNIQETIYKIEESWKKAAPDWPANYFFLDERVDQLYKKDRAILDLLEIFTIVALSLCLMGIFGVVSFALLKRSKELSIRKVLGANTIDIIKDINKEYFMIILISNLIAWPIAFALIHKWLNTFAYKTMLDLSLFFISGLSTLLIVLIITVSKTLITSKQNPVKSLRQE